MAGGIGTCFYSPEAIGKVLPDRAGPSFIRKGDDGPKLISLPMMQGCQAPPFRQPAHIGATN